MTLGPGEHQEELAHAAAEAHHVEHGVLAARDLDAIDLHPPAPQVVGRRGAQRQGRHLPEAQATVERGLVDLPLLDHRLFGVPADRVRRVVCPDRVRVAVLVRIAVGVGDDDVAGLEVRYVGAHREDFADRRVAGIDLAAAGLHDVDGVREHGVIHVVLPGDGQDLEMDIAPPDLAKLHLVELDHVREVDLVEIATDAFRSPG